MTTNENTRNGNGATVAVLALALIAALAGLGFELTRNGTISLEKIGAPAQTKVQAQPAARQQSAPPAAAPAARVVIVTPQPAPSTEGQAVQAIPPKAAPVAPADVNVTDLPPGYNVDASGQMWHDTGVGAPQQVYPTVAAPEAQLSQAELDASAASAEQNLIDSALSGLTPEEQEAARVAAENQAWNNAGPMGVKP